MNSAGGGELQTFKAAFFKALAHPVRIRILELLVQRDLSVQELQEALGVEQPVVSQQLGVLRTSNIVVGKKQGVSVRYAVRDQLVGDLARRRPPDFQQSTERDAGPPTATPSRAN